MSNHKFYEYLRGLIGNLRSNPKRFWTFLKSVKGKHGSIPLLMDGDRKVTADVDKAELLNRTFAGRFTRRQATRFPAAPDYPLNPFQTFALRPGSVRAILDSISPYKACGPDGVSARVIRECSAEISVPLTIICQLSVDQGVFPKSWKRANVVPIFKKGLRRLPSNYRSVSLLPLFSKVLERVVYESLFAHVRPVLSDHQHGFMPHRSCVTNLATMLDEAWKNISLGLQTDVIYTDYSAAFQSVNHDLLLHKLSKSFKISGRAFNWLQSYFTDREQRVVLNGKCSAWSSVPSGTPEGSILSPLLFSCFINDLPLSVNANCLMFADDVKIYHRIQTQSDCTLLQKQLDALCHWSQLWGLTLNAAKCKVLTLSLRRDRVAGTYHLGGETLERVTEMRDLGVILDEKLTFASHVECVARKANGALGLLIRSFQTGKHGKTFYGCDSGAIISAYCANVRSILEYGSVIWGGAAATHLARLESIQHKFMMWLCCRCRIADVPLRNDALQRRFDIVPLSKRREQHDLMFIRNIHRHTIDSSYLLEKMPLAVPVRHTRRHSLFHVPYARVNTVKCGLFVRLPVMCNTFLDANREADLWSMSAFEWKRAVKRHVGGPS